MSSTANIALTALRAFDGKISIIANNINSINADGFKKSRAVMEAKVPSGANG